MNVELGEREIDAVLGKFVVEFFVVVVENIPIEWGARPCAYLQVHRRFGHFLYEHFGRVVGTRNQGGDAGAAFLLEFAEMFFYFAVTVQQPVDDASLLGLFGSRLTVGAIFIDNVISGCFC